jgi:hypothetical protein
MTALLRPTLAVLIVGSVAAAVGALGGAGSASASPCDPVGFAMTPQPVLSCPGPSNPAPPIVGASPQTPIDAAAALPAPGQAPHVPPLADPNWGPTDGQLGFLSGLVDSFSNGIPSNLPFGSAPAPPA